MCLKQDSTSVLVSPVQPGGGGLSNGIRVARSTRNLFVLKSLTLILILTVLVLGINYYLISNCPKDEEQQQQGRGISIGDNQSIVLLPLIPVWKKYRSELNVRLVPFGKGNVADRNGAFQFTCQHGPEECHGNKLHACLVHNHPNATTQMDVIGCSMERFRLWGATIKSIYEVMSECITEQISDNNHKDELLSSNANQLLATHGYETLGLRPRVTFIPTISIDHSLGNQAQVLRDLDGVICKILRKRNPEQNC